MRAIRKRLHSQMSKNNAVVMYTLTVLETCVKNCDIRFHELVCQKDFVNELVRLLGPKFDAPQVIQEHVLGLIQVTYLTVLIYIHYSTNVELIFDCACCFEFSCFAFRGKSLGMNHFQAYQIV